MSFFIRKILIKKSQEELGFSLAGQGPCVVNAIILGSLADQAQLRCGDEVLEVNFVNVTQMHYEAVSKIILRKAGIGNVILNVRTLYFQNVIGGHCFSQDRVICNSPAYTLRRSHFKYWSTSSTQNDAPTVENDNSISKLVETTFLPTLFGVRTSKPAHETKLINNLKRFDYKVFAFYNCSKEIRRNDNIAASSLDCLRSCVLLLKKKETKHNSLVLFGINREGISLLNVFGKDITIYPLKNIVFSAVCSEDRNYFGFVCKSVLQSEDGIVVSRYDCHVFMIDKNICKHENHKKFAALLDLPCLQNEECDLFPSSASQILKKLNAIYEGRRGEGVNEDTRKPFLLTVSSPETHRKRDTQKLMTTPPSSLTSLDACEKEELLKGLTSSPFTRSLTRKPPVPHKVPSEGSLSRKNGGFGSLFQRGRRMSEGIFKSSSDLSAHRIQDISTRSPLFSPKRDTNENLKRLSIASSASESSINKSLFNKVEGWSASFENLLGDEVGLACFRAFLQQEYSEENIEFWIACEKYKQIQDCYKMKLEADTIFQQYLSPTASSLVNVNQNGVKNVEDNLQRPHSELFSTPQNQVFHLMKFDSYKRFLKSNFYKQCLEAERSGKRIPYGDESSDKRSSKTYQDGNGDWKKQILNFLSKGGKRSDLKTLRKEFTIGDRKDQEHDESTRLNFDRRSSLKDDQLWDGLHTQSKGNFLRIFFPDGTSTIIVVEHGVTLKDTLSDVCKSKQLSLNSFDVTMGCPRKIASLDQEISKLNDNVVYLEKRILFRFDLPNGRSVGIKANPNKSLRDILQPVLKKNGFEITDYSFYIMNSKHAIPLSASISVVDNKRLQSRRLHKKLEKQTSDSSSVKHSSDLRSSLRRLRTSSFNKEEKTKLDAKKEEDTNHRTFLGNEMKHILLGKSKSNEDGTSALLSVLQRSQSSRMDDQRGLLPSDLELPDFLKSPPATPATATSESDILPSPRGSLNSVTCSPSKSVPFPPSPLIVDKFSSQYSFDSNRSPLLTRSMNSGLFSVTSWKEVASPDRELIDKSYTNTLSSDGYDSQSKPSLLELYRSDPSLSKETVRRSSSTLTSKPNTDSNQSSKEQLNQSLDNLNDSFDLGIHEVSPITKINIKRAPNHTTRLGSIDLINYDLSPRDTSSRRLLDPFEENEKETVFLHNAIPTPEKSKLLQGETILGRKNEKITYV